MQFGSRKASDFSPQESAFYWLAAPRRLTCFEESYAPRSSTQTCSRIPRTNCCCPLLTFLLVSLRSLPKPGLPVNLPISPSPPFVPRRIDFPARESLPSRRLPLPWGEGTSRCSDLEPLRSRYGAHPLAIYSNYLIYIQYSLCWPYIIPRAQFSSAGGNHMQYEAHYSIYSISCTH